VIVRRLKIRRRLAGLNKNSAMSRKSADEQRKTNDNEGLPSRTQSTCSSKCTDDWIGSFHPVLVYLLPNSKGPRGSSTQYLGPGAHKVYAPNKRSELCVNDINFCDRKPFGTLAGAEGNLATSYLVCGSVHLDKWLQ